MEKTGVAGNDQDTWKNEHEAMGKVMEAIGLLNLEGKRRVIGWAAGTIGLVAPPPATPNTNRPLQSAAGGNESTLTPEDYLVGKAPNSLVERFVVLGSYLTKYRQQADFKTEEIQALNDEADQPKFDAAVQAGKDAVKLQFVVGTMEGRRKLTSRGKALVEALPNRDAVKGVLERIPLAGVRKTAGRKADVEDQAETEAEEVEGNDETQASRPKARRPRVAPAASTMENLKPITTADPEIIGRWSDDIARLPKKYGVYGVLALARSLGVNTVSFAEFEALNVNVLRLGIPRGTWTSYLAIAPASEVHKGTGPDGKPAYQLLKKGEEIWNEQLRLANEETVTN
jgi:hypothetical protein